MWTERKRPPLADFFTVAAVGPFDYSWDIWDTNAGASETPQPHSQTSCFMLSRARVGQKFPGGREGLTPLFFSPPPSFHKSNKRCGFLSGHQPLSLPLTSLHHPSSPPPCSPCASLPVLVSRKQQRAQEGGSGKMWLCSSSISREAAATDSLFLSVVFCRQGGGAALVC